MIPKHLSNIPRTSLQSAENTSRRKPLARKSHSRIGSRLDGSCVLSQSRLSGYEDIIISGNNSPSRLVLGSSIQNSPDAFSNMILGGRPDCALGFNEYGF